MSFGLKIAIVIYQRLMDKVFNGMIDQNMEVYVDDIIVKSDSCNQHVKDFEEDEHEAQPREVCVRCWGRSTHTYGIGRSTIINSKDNITGIQFQNSMFSNDRGDGRFIQVYKGKPNHLRVYPVKPRKMGRLFNGSDRLTTPFGSSALTKTSTGSNV